MLFANITVVIPAYNNGSTLGRTLDSVLPQCQEDDEVVVVNDGSTDGTVAIIDAFKRSHRHHFHFIHQENAGPARARNQGVLHAHNDYILFLDADDCLSVNALSALREEIKKHPETLFFIGGYQRGKRVTCVNKKYFTSSHKKNLIHFFDKKIKLAQGAFLLHKKALAVIGYPEHLVGEEDLPFFIQLLAHYIPQPIEPILVHCDANETGLRKKMPNDIEHAKYVAEAAFNPKIMPQHLMPLKNCFYAQRLLSLARRAYHHGHHSLARRATRAAIYHYPKILFQSRVLKYLYGRI